MTRRYRLGFADLGLMVGAIGGQWDDDWTDGDTRINSEGREVPKIAIPKGENERRQEYDRRLRIAQEDYFGTLAGPVRVPVDTELVTNKNPIKNRDRYDMYVRMAKAGDRLPPIIVRPEPRYDGRQGWLVLDGNHRWFAAQAAGLTEVDALVTQSTAFGGLWRS